jgi:hypothetical protein
MHAELFVEYGTDETFNQEKPSTLTRRKVGADWAVLGAVSIG